MSTWGQYTFELNENNKLMAERVAMTGCWDEVEEEIRNSTNLSGIFTDVFRGYMNAYDFRVEAFNDDVQIALEIIEKKYLQLFKDVL